MLYAPYYILPPSATVVPEVTPVPGLFSEMALKAMILAASSYDSVYRSSPTDYRVRLKPP